MADGMEAWEACIPVSREVNSLAQAVLMFMRNKVEKTTMSVS
ncbi:hypothetical protein [Oxobacter pfennigii]|nr:hypothetical protein [Oxobacter pfennigii]